MRSEQLHVKPQKKTPTRTSVAIAPKSHYSGHEMHLACQVGGSPPPYSVCGVFRGADGVVMSIEASLASRAAIGKCASPLYRVQLRLAQPLNVASKLIRPFEVPVAPTGSVVTLHPSALDRACRDLILIGRVLIVGRGRRMWPQK